MLGVVNRMSDLFVSSLGEMCMSVAWDAECRRYGLRFMAKARSDWT